MGPRVYRSSGLLFARVGADGPARLGWMTEQSVEPFAVGRLDVGDGHVLYYEQVGHPEGTPVVYLHGGPGSGCTPEARSSTNQFAGSVFDSLVIRSLLASGASSLTTRS